MGFRTLAIEQRSGVLGAVKAEFGKFGDTLDKVQKKLTEASNTIETAQRRSRRRRAQTAAGGGTAGGGLRRRCWAWKATPRRRWKKRTRPAKRREGFGARSSKKTGRHPELAKDL
ncbi:MAG: hypothetical protein WDN28_04225 [Chthoniobacter sp.]